MTVEINKPFGVWRIEEPGEYIFFPEAVGQEIWVEAPAVELVNPILDGKGTGNRGIGINGANCTVRNPTIFGYAGSGLAWWSEAFKLRVIGGHIHHCAVPIYGVALGVGEPGANQVVVEGAVCEDTITTGGDEHGFGLQNGSYGYYDLTLRRGNAQGCVAYQSTGKKMQYNVFKLKVENFLGRAFDFGGDASIKDGQAHKGNRVTIEAKNCGVGLRLKARESDNPWRICARLENCAQPIEWLGEAYRARVESTNGPQL